MVYFVISFFNSSGLPISESPDFSYACLRDGTKVFPRSVLTSTASGPGLVLVKEHKIVRREGHMDLTHTLTTGNFLYFYPLC